MTGDEIRRAQFREARRGGYRAEDVDLFLERLAAAADRPEALAPLIDAHGSAKPSEGATRLRTSTDSLNKPSRPVR